MIDLKANLEEVNSNKKLKEILAEAKRIGLDTVVFAYDDTFRYMLLYRMKGDCEYFIDSGRSSVATLWAGNPAKQIAYMKLLYRSFSEEGKPQWLSIENIEIYEKMMVSEALEEKLKELKSYSEIRNFDASKYYSFDVRTLQDMKGYGYTWEGMYPISAREAKQKFKEFKGCLYKLYPDDTEGLVEDVSEITDDYLYGIEMGIHSPAI